MQVTDESGGALSTLRSARAADPDRQRWQEALDAARQRYKRLSDSGKRKLLDELELLTGYHRKTLLRLLNQLPSPAPVTGDNSADDTSTSKPHHRRRYGPAAAAGLVPLWEASDRLCGKRLKALLPLLVESLERHVPLAWIQRYARSC